MLFDQHLVVVRGGGDLGTGVIARLHRSGFPVLVTELARPLTVRRTVAVSSAVLDGDITVEGVYATRVDDLDKAVRYAHEGIVPVVVSTILPAVPRSIVVDARVAKRNIDTSLDDARFVVALGPGFTAGHDCHAVVETARGHHLGRVLWEGSAEPDTGIPGTIAGHSTDRVLRSPLAGLVKWRVNIGDIVQEGEEVGTVSSFIVRAPFTGVVRGLIAGGVSVPIGAKIGDLDPRLDTPCNEISDKALAIGGGVLEAVMTWLSAIN